MKILPLLLISPFVLVALALVVVLVLGISPLALVYFLFNRWCAYREDLKASTTSRRAKGARRGKKLKLPSFFNFIPALRGKENPNQAGRQPATSPELQ